MSFGLGMLPLVLLVILPLLGIAGGIVLWRYMLHREKAGREISFREIVIIVIVVGVACRIAFVIFTPTFFAPDEHAHFNYVKHIYENGSFPVHNVSEFWTAKAEHTYENFQPPLYYLTLLPAYWLADNISGGSEYFILRSVRLMSIFIWLIHVFFALKILEKLKIKSFFINVFTITMICLLPTYVSMSSCLNVSNLLVALGSILLYLLTGKSSLGKSVLLGVVFGVVLLTKVTGAMYLLAIGGVLAIQVIRKTTPLSSAILYLIVTSVLAGLIYLPWAIRDLTVYNNLIMANVCAKKQWKSVFHAFFFAEHQLKHTFWAVSGTYNHVRFLTVIGVHLMYFAVIGLIYGLFSKSRPLFDYFRGDKGSFMTATALVAIVHYFFVLVRIGMVHLQPQGRYTYSMLIPLTLLMAIGIKLFLRIKIFNIAQYTKRAHIHTVGFFATYLFSFAGFSLGMFSRV